MKRVILVLCLSLLWSNTLNAEPCPKKVSAQKTITATFLKETQHADEDCFGYLLQDSKGKKIDVLMGNGDFLEFQDLKKGDLIRLSYKTEQFRKGKQCAKRHLYENDSGKILKKK